LAAQKTDFSKWEKHLEPCIKEQMINKLRNFKELDFFFNIQKSLPDSLFHIVDFDKDGLDDIIFHGFVANEIELILFFKNEEYYFRKVLSTGGYPIYISDPNDNYPMSFVLKQYPCCADYVSIIENIQPSNLPGEFKYLITSKESYCDLECCIFPNRFFQYTFKFITTQPKTSLRITPFIDDTTSYLIPGVNSKGNSVAKYPIGSIGVALAEAKDSTARIWYFVKMLNNIKPIENFLHGGFMDTLDYYSYGWVSSRVIKKIENVK
jgi:hypothetical protein